MKFYNIFSTSAIIALQTLLYNIPTFRYHPREPHRPVPTFQGLLLLLPVSSVRYTSWTSLIDLTLRGAEMKAEVSTPCSMALIPLET